MRMIRQGAVAAVLMVLGGCGGAGNGSPDGPIGDVKVASITTGSTYSFDIGTVFNGKYYVTDRNNKAVDVVDIATMKFSLITGTGANAFAGCSPTANCVGANNGKSGPDGLNVVGNLLYVGDKFIGGCADGGNCGPPFTGNTAQAFSLGLTYDF